MGKIKIIICAICGEEMESENLELDERINKVGQFIYWSEDNTQTYISLCRDCSHRVAKFIQSQKTNN